jgi:hypothetical protein
MHPHVPTAVVPLHAHDGRNASIKYAWNGKNVTRVSHHTENTEDTVLHKLRSSADVASVLDSVTSSFFPSSDQVTPDYWEYIKWRGWHRLFSSMSSIFSTQSLLLAVGVGARNTLPAAAGINWVLKDGLGRLGRLTVATKFGESFDADLKRFRFASSCIYGVSLLIENLTPLVPQYFLPMAAVANVGKSVGLTTYISTQPAFYKSFAKVENISDISAKSQAQQMAIDTLGLALAVSLNLLVKKNATMSRMLPLAMFPILVPGDLYSIYNELRSVHLRTLNKERAELVAEGFVKSQRVLTPDAVSTMERFVLPSEASAGEYPLEIRGLDGMALNEEDVHAFRARRNRAHYFLTRKREGKGYSVAFRADCNSKDILQVVLTMAHLRASGIGFEEAERLASRQVNGFVKQLTASGWQVEPFTLSRTERMFYKIM